MTVKGFGVREYRIVSAHPLDANRVVGELERQRAGGQLCGVKVIELRLGPCVVGGAIVVDVARITELRVALQLLEYGAILVQRRRRLLKELANGGVLKRLLHAVDHAARHRPDAGVGALNDDKLDNFARLSRNQHISSLIRTIQSIRNE